VERASDTRRPSPAARAGTDGKRAAEILSELRGPNLETGLYGDTAEHLPHVSKNGLEPLFGMGYAAYNINEVH
jgi:hypothetical protein